MLTLLLLLTALWLGRTTVVSALAPMALSWAGWENAEVRVKSFDHRHLALEHAQAHIPAGAGPLRAQLKGLRYDFHLQRLLDGAFGGELKIAHARIVLPPPPKNREHGEGEPAQGFSLARIGQMLHSLKLLPLSSLTVERLELLPPPKPGETQPAIPLLRLEYCAAVDGHAGWLKLARLGEAAPPLELALDRDGDAVTARMAFDLARLREWLPPEWGAPQGKGKMELRLGPGRAELSLQAGELRLVDWELDKAEFACTASLSAEEGQEKLDFDHAAQARLAGLRGPALRLDAAELPLYGRLSWGKGKYDLDLRPAGQLRLAGLAFGEKGNTEIASLVLHKLHVQAKFASAKFATIQDENDADTKSAEGEWGHIQLGPESQLEISQLAADGVRIARASGPIPLDISLAQSRQRLEWRPGEKKTVFVQGLVTGPVGFHPVNFKKVQCSLDNTAQATALRLDVDLPEAGGPLRLAWNAKRGKAEQELVLSTPKPLRVSPEASLLKIFRQPELPVPPEEVERGTFRARLRLAWGDKPFSCTLESTLSDANLHHGGFRYVGVNANHHLQFAPSFKSLKSGTITVKSITGPLALSDIALNLNLQAAKKKDGWPVLFIERGEVGLLGGKLATRACPYYLESSRVSACEFTLHDLDLAAMLALHPVEGLELEGRVDGILPFAVGPKGPGVRQGKIAGRGGGVIRYQPESDALKGSTYGEYALKALQEYRYDKLTADLSYKTNGDLLIGLHLEGKSPKLSDTRPVHLNIQTEQNVLSLLKSLNYSQGLTSELDRWMQKQYRPKK